MTTPAPVERLAIELLNWIATEKLDAELADLAATVCHWMLTAATEIRCQCASGCTPDGRHLPGCLSHLLEHDPRQGVDLAVLWHAIPGDDETACACRQAGVDEDAFTTALSWWLAWRGALSNPHLPAFAGLRPNDSAVATACSEFSADYADMDPEAKAQMECDALLWWHAWSRIMLSRQISRLSLNHRTKRAASA